MKYHQYSVSTILQAVTPISFYIYCIVLQKINSTRQLESQLSLRPFALSFRVKDY